MTPARAPSSKQFLIDRIVQQATLEGVPLADVEIRMLGFSEASASAKDMEAAQAFERDFNDEEYEAKIAELIRHAYEDDRKTSEVQTLDNALARIAIRDIYLNVMIDRAGIKSTSSAALFSDWRFIIYGLLPPGLSLAAAAIVGLSPLGARLIRNDALRLSIALLLMASPFVIQRIARSKLWKTRRKHRHSSPD
jgi:hypothetical protein